jgi:small subunit ribosomal protein S6
MTNQYEVTIILRPGLEEADVDARAATFSEVVTSRGGELVGPAEKLGKKRLAYEINDVREGHYIVIGYKTDGVTSKELERQLKLHEDVLRHLVVRLEKRMLEHMNWLAANTPPPIAPPYA